jgi:uncharacterized membrane protein
MRIALIPSLRSLAAAAWVSPAAAQQFVALPNGYQARDVSPDGTIVVGYAGSNGFIWRWKQDPAPTVITGGGITATSDDGSVLIGDTKNPNTNKFEASIWTQANGWQRLGGLAGQTGCDATVSSALSVSGDGTVVVGLAYGGFGGPCQANGFRWTAATGMQPLALLGNAGNRCSSVSRDGSTMGGFAKGTFQRTPAYWDTFLLGSILDLNYQGEVFGFNNDGSKSVGKIETGTGSFNAFVRDRQSGVITQLGQLTPGMSGNAMDISEDGNVIVGWDNLGTSGEAWVWTSSDGIISLSNRLAALGITGVPPLKTAYACSDSGSVIVGGGSLAVGFIVELPGLVSFGTGTPGCNGLPVLTASPFPRVNTPTFTLSSTNAPPSSLGLAMITNVADVAGSDPFFIGAQLHVDLINSTEVITLDATSDSSGNGTAPCPIPNIPALIGAKYYSQILWAWPFSTCFMAPYNISTTNGVAITIHP